MSINIGILLNLIMIVLPLCQCSHKNTESLQLVISIFRHGDRTNELTSVYPKDPYINETYFPYDYGQLINKGKIRLYRLGQEFRKRYGSFLGKLYFPGLIDALSTDYDRTKCSLQLFLAGLFPPANTILEWNKSLNWNPIPFKSVSFQENRILSFPLFFCPKYQVLFNAYKQSAKSIAIENRYKSMYPYISEESGLNVTSVLDLFGLYFGLRAEEEWGFKLPEWTKMVYPEYLTKAAHDVYFLLTATPELNQLNGGFLLKKIINDMYNKTNDVSHQPKMYIYSGHEVTVVAILAALNLNYPHVPNYGACVVLELHDVNGTQYVKVRYNKDVTNNFVDMIIPGCKVMCPIDQLANLLQQNLPVSGDPCI